MGDIPRAFQDRYNSPVHPNGLTHEEWHEIKTLWDTMPGTTSFADALQKVAQN